MSPELINIIVGLIGGFIGYFIKDYVDQRKELKSQQMIDRREHYRNLLLSLKSLSEGKREHTALLSFEYQFLWLHAPDSVIRSANKLIQKLNSQGKQPKVLDEVGELVLEMRKDLCFQKTKLSTNDFDSLKK